MWQDYVFTAGSILFILALLPAVFKSEKPPLSTCGLTAAVLYVFAFTQSSLDLKFAAVTTGFTAAMWTILLLQPRESIG